MVAWAVKDFGGEIPRRDPRALPDNMAEEAWNCDLASGPLDGLPTPQLVADLSATAGTVRRAYRFPGPSVGDPDVWLPLPSEFSAVCRSPLANDTSHRIYWTNPPDSSVPGQFWNTYARIAAGNTGANAPYNLGTAQPGLNLFPDVVASGGTAVPLIARSYCWTYVNQYGEESAPSGPSGVITGASDGTWTINGLPTTAPANPAGKNYPPTIGLNLYRTSTGTNTGAQFYQVKQFVYGVNSPPSSYVDAVSDTTAVGNTTLISASWSNPLDNLDGLTALPGGMLVGFTDNTVHFCEPNRPHAWPAGYDQSVQYKIVALAVWQQSLAVVTQGFPSNGSGTSPSNFTFSAVQVPEPCISRGSVIADLMGVYYASQNGLVMLNYFGMQNQTLSNFTRTVWLRDFHAASIIACRHRAQYLAINGTGTGFLIDYTEPRMGVVPLNTFSNVVAIWNDNYTGDAYVIADKKVYLWDSTTADSLVFRWKSKQFYLPTPANIGAIQISLDPSVEDAPPSPSAPPLDNGDASFVLPDDANAVFKLYAGEHLIMTKKLTKARMLFRSKSGFKAFNWQFEIVSRVPVHSVEIASTMKELKGV